MADYTCSWIIQVEADSPLEAATLAEEIVLDNPDYARNWRVTDPDNEEEDQGVIINLAFVPNEEFED